MPRVTADYTELLDDPDIDVIDVVTGNRPHFQVSWDALNAGKHVLCEKPVHNDYRKTRQAAALAAERGLRTKLGFTFRYAPAIRYAKELIDSGFVGEPFIFNGFEQNSQWLDPATPLRQVDPQADPGQIAVSSIEGYGAPIIDIMHWWVGAPLASVVGTMRNFVPDRMIRDTGRMTRANIDDGDMWIAEFCSGALASIQSSYVTVGNYPGIEARIYGSAGAIIVRLVDEFGCCQTIKTARGDAVEFTDVGDPGQVLPARRPLRRALGIPLLLQPGGRLPGRDLRQRPAKPGRLRPGRAGAGDHQRVRGVVPHPGVDQLPAGRASVNVTSNAERLVRQILTGEVWPPLGDRHVYRTGPDGQAFALPGMGGMTLGVHCGDPATGYASDHLEPGASVRHRDPGANMALQFLTCVGNAVRVESGPAAGAVGHVIGQHAYVLVDFAAPVAEQVTTGDEVTVTAVGQGLALPGHPAIVVKNCDPGLLARMPGGTRPDGRLEVHVAARIPAEAVGAGAGMASEYANTDLMGAYAGLGEDLSLGLEGLRIGDIVAVADADHRFGRGYRPGSSPSG